MKEINIVSRMRVDFIDITGEIQKFIKDEDIYNGIVWAFVPHTTAGVTINVNEKTGDPDVIKDIKKGLIRLAPYEDGYDHYEMNSDSHIMATLVGSSVPIFVESGDLMLGEWQSVFFCEFDGQRKRKVWLQGWSL